MTTTLPPPGPALGATGIPLLPENPSRMGPVTKRLVARTAGLVLGVQLLGTVLAVVGGTTLRTLGLSMVLPGGGFLYGAHPIAFAVTASLLFVAVVLWWAMSAGLGILLVWAGSGAAAVAALHGPRVLLDRGTTWGWTIPITYLLAAAAWASLVWTFEKRFRAKRAKVGELNEYLATATIPTPSTPLREPDAMDAELLRWAYELCLQPIDEFVGFEWGEQFHGGTVVRYQLNYLGWALAPYAVNYVPNAICQIEPAMANLVEKSTDLRVWGYWRTLNLIGNLDPNPDPLVRDNIMFSGFTGDQINMYVASTGSKRFDEPGSLTFVWKDGRTFSYDHGTWMEQVRKNFVQSDMGFFPCEPGWAFAACNAIGAQALLGYDTTHGTSLWEEVEPRWRKTLEEEYLLPDGNYANIRSTHTGLSWDTGETHNGEYLVTGTNQFQDIAPDYAARGKALATRHLPMAMGGLAMAMKDGELPMELPLEWERNRARKTAVNGWTKIIGGARMAGMEDLASAAQRAMERQCATGERWPERPLAVGVQNLCMHLIGRWSTPLNNGDLNVRGYVPPVGPVVESAPWPEVMITLARSADGESLDLGLVPGAVEATEPVTLGFRSLRPGRTYRLTGDGVAVSMTADERGLGSLSLPVTGALRLVLAPVEVAA